MIHAFEEYNMTTKTTFTLIALTHLVLVCSSPSMSQLDGHRSDLEYIFSITGYEENNWFGKPSAIAIDERHSLIYVADAKQGAIYSFGLNGTPQDYYGTKQDLRCPVGLAVDKEGNLYIAEDAGGPIKVIMSNQEVKNLPLPTDESEEVPKPGRMTVDNEGNLYVVDRLNSRIYVLDKEHKVKFTIGGKGEKKGQFKSLCDVAVDQNGRIYALDSMGAPVQVFDKKGKYLYKFGFRGEGVENIASASAIHVDRLGQVWVTDKGQHCIKIFDRSGTFLKNLLSYGTEPGALLEPIDIEMDRYGRVYVAEENGRRIQVFLLSRPFEPFEPAMGGI